MCGARPEVLVRVVIDHDKNLRYHQWVTIGHRLSVNRLAVPNPRIAPHNASKWFCNNSRCPAWGIVRDRHAEQALACLDNLE